MTYITSTEVPPAPLPSIAPMPGATGEQELGIEMFLILVAVLVFCYSLGSLTLHIIASVKKRLRRRRNRRGSDSYDAA